MRTEEEMPVIPEEGADMPPAMPQPAGPGEVAVPLKSLAQPDNEEQLQTPAEGDTVNFTVDAQVVRIDGENAYVRPTAINGTPIEDEAAEPQPDADEQEGADLRAMAEQAGM